jgi:hypothetical protein
MPDLPYLRAEIEHMRRQIVRQRKEMRDLERAGIPTKSAEELLERMLAKVDGLCAERDTQVKESESSPPDPEEDLTSQLSQADVDARMKKWTSSPGLRRPE